MADPLSVATAVITLVDATVKISSVCREYYVSVRDSKETVLQLLSEIQTLRSIAEHLDLRLRGGSAANLSDQDDDDDDSDSGEVGHRNLPIVQSLMNNDGVFARCVTCLDDLEKRLAAFYSAWFSEKQGQEQATETSDKGRQKRDKIRNLTKRLTWPLKEGEMKETIETIRRLCNVIQLAMGAEMLFKVENIDRKTDAVHNVVTDIQRTQAAQTTLEDTKRAAEAAAQEKRRQRLQRHAVCSLLDSSRKREAKNESAYKLRAPNTSMWLLESALFKAWKAGREPRKTFWLQAIPGGGKTVLASTVIHHLNEELKPATAALAYFYFDASDNNLTTSDKMLRSLLAQLVMVQDCGPLPKTAMRIARKCLSKHRLVGLFAEDPTAGGTADVDFGSCDIKDTDDGVSSPSTDTVLTALKETVLGLTRKGRNIYIIIDALDECTDLDELLDVLDCCFLGGGRNTNASLARLSLEDQPDCDNSVHLFCTSRPVPKIADTFDADTTIVVAADTEEGQNKDISGMVRQQLKQDKKLRSWSSMHEEMQVALTSRAQGMFRLAACQLDILRKCKTLRSLREALKTLPTSLSETYKRTIMAVDKDDRAYSVRALLWLAVSHRPLTVLEMVDILATVEDADKDSAAEECSGFVFDEEQRINDLADIPVLCTTLVQTVVPEYVSEASAGKFELRLAHHTVREYVLSDLFFELVGNDKSLPAFLRRIADRWALNEHVATTLLSYIYCLQDPAPNHIGMTMCAETDEWSQGMPLKNCCKARGDIKIGRTNYNPGCWLRRQLQKRPLAAYAAQEWVVFFNKAQRTNNDGNIALITLAMRMLGPEDGSHDDVPMSLSYVNMVQCRYMPADPREWWRTIQVQLPLQFASNRDLDTLLSPLVQAWDRSPYPFLQDADAVARPELFAAIVHITFGDDRPLVNAALQGNHAFFDELLEHKSRSGSTSISERDLWDIVGHDCADFLRKLLKLDAVYQPSRRMLYYVLSRNAVNVNCAELLFPLASKSDLERALIHFYDPICRRLRDDMLLNLSKHIPLAAFWFATKSGYDDLVPDMCSQHLGAGDVTGVRHLLSRGALDVTVPVWSQGGIDYYPLNIAVACSNLDFLRLFLDYGVALGPGHSHYATILALALTQAAYAADLDCVRMLVEEGHASLTGTRYGSPVKATISGLRHHLARTEVEIEEACAVLEYLLAHGADANQTPLPTLAVTGHETEDDETEDDETEDDETEDTPLLMAATDEASAALAVSTILLKHGADPNLTQESRGYRTPLREAIYESNMDLVQLLLRAGADPNLRSTPRVFSYGLSEVDMLPPLVFAIQTRKASFVQVLLKAGADANGLYEKSSGGEESVLAFCGSLGPLYGNEEDPLVMLRMLLDAGADPHRNGCELLCSIIERCYAGSIERLRLLVVDYGVDVNAATDVEVEGKPRGWTALFSAATNKGPFALAYLLDEAGADPHARLADGRCAVHVAAQRGCAKSLEVLAKHLDMNVQCHAGQTPLHYATMFGNARTVEWLLQTGGADESIRDRAGFVARDFALRF